MSNRKFRFSRASGAAVAAFAAVFLLLSQPAVATPVTGGLELWLDANDPSTFTFDSGTLVSQWRDKSGGMHHAATASNFPSLQNNMIGGLPAVAFDRQPLDIAGGLDIVADQDRTAFVVMDYSLQTQNSEMFGTSTGNMVDVGNWNRPWRLRLRQSDNAFSPANSLPAGSHVIAVRGNHTGTHAWSDGRRIINTSDKRFHWAMNANLGIGGARFSGREYRGNLGEVLVYNRTLDPFETNEVGFYLQEKFNLVGSYADPASLGTSVLPVDTGLQLWLDASDPAAFTFDSEDRVAQWHDKSGQDHHASTGSNFPTLQPNVIGGLPAVAFRSTQGGAAAGTPLTISGGLDVAAGQDRTVLMVMDYSSMLGNNEVFGATGGEMIDVGTWTPSGHQNERLRLRGGGNSSFSPAGTVPAGANLVAVQADASGVRAWRNGSPILEDAVNTFGWNMNRPLQVGGANFSTRTYNGDLAEMIVFDRTLSDAEMTQLGLYLEQKYSIFGVYGAPVREGLKLWLDATDPRTLVLDADNKLQRWVDRSGNGHDAAPLGGRPAPQWLADGINGRAAVDFVQADRNVMGIAGDMGIADGQERTVFVVFDYGDLLNNNEILGTSTGKMIDVGTWTPSGRQDERLRLRYDGISAFSLEGELLLGPHVLVVQARADGSFAWSDGVEIINTADLAAHYAIGTDLKIGGTDFNTRDFDGRIAEILFYDRALTLDEIGQVGLYLEQKYFVDTLIPEPGSILLFGLGSLLLWPLLGRRLSCASKRAPAQGAGNRT